ncbi:uncharacterized protein LOC104898849 isoform X1 [Beta vulgaris subsp. vulgaris]|uniref:uncharacterized protein LOC104898849 isoform X1 n=1 Tax=Beta vulgaris subsp. vulgaris TaxID=3555 RepID=UPI002036B881|nr:uncharacterized protein LOC104898849 isoform X1 [Beta vulgaris subsp. vulgaris]
MNSFLTKSQISLLFSKLVSTRTPIEEINKMGRKARATKQTPALKSLSELQISAARGIFVNTKSDPHLADSSHPVKKKRRIPTAMIRRSARIQNTVDNQESEPVIEEIMICGSQKDDDGPLRHEENKTTEQSSDEIEGSSKKDNRGAADVRYKTMYTCYKTKIEDLLEENKKLSKALELANGKIYVYERQSNMFSEVMAVIASLSRVNENLSAPKHGPPDNDNEEFEGLN